jgi:hypothetical protein
MYSNKSNHYQIVQLRHMPDKIYGVPPQTSLAFPSTMLDSAPTRTAAYLKLMQWQARLKCQTTLLAEPKVQRGKLR